MSALELGPIGLGTAPLGGLFDAVDDQTAHATVERAWELGVRYFDTAPLYGSGLAERRLGAALRDHPRGDFVVSTKVGRLLEPGPADPIFKGAPPLRPVFDFSAAGVRRSLEESLERLQLDCVDLVLMHDPEEHLDAALAALESVRDLAAAVGVGTNSTETALRFVREGGVDYVLIAGRFTLLDASAGDELLPLCLTQGVPVIAAGVFNSGLLAGGSMFDYQTASDDLVTRREALSTICNRYDVPLQALALQFPRRHPAVASVLVGARSATEIEEDVGLVRHRIPRELWNEPLIPPM